MAVRGAGGRVVVVVLVLGVVVGAVELGEGGLEPVHGAGGWADRGTGGVEEARDAVGGHARLGANGGIMGVGEGGGAIGS